MRAFLILATTLAIASTTVSALAFADPTDNLYTITNSSHVSTKCRTCLIPTLHKSSPLCAKETNPPSLSSSTPAKHLKCWDAIRMSGNSSASFQACIAPKECTLAESSFVQMYYIRQAETVRAEIEAAVDTPKGTKFADPVDNLYTVSDSILSTGCKTCIYPVYQTSTPDCANESNPPSFGSIFPAQHVRCWDSLARNETVFQPCVAQKKCSAGEVTIFEGYVARQAETVRAVIAADPEYAFTQSPGWSFIGTTTGSATGAVTTGKPTGLAVTGKSGGPASGAMGLVASEKIVAFGAFVAMAAAGLVL
ncbi:MAG: hypothetical protein J3R72DRAFT_464365 [Linnemannia gamsii]|nr:MAG: hypothetical protein J3R72DRAFT_464365 [Linnemannia gamsii]